MKSTKTSKPLLGRDPCKGMVTFATGTILSQRNRHGNRKTKAARNLLRRQLRGE